MFYEKEEKSAKDLRFEMNIQSETEPPLDFFEREKQSNVVQISERIQKEMGQWKELIKIKSELLDVEKLALETLPNSLVDFVSDVSSRMQNSPDFIAVGLMVCLSSVVGRKFAIQPKQLDACWHETPNLWGALVGKPSSMKSPTLAQAIKFTLKLEKQKRDDYENEKQEYLNNQEFIKIELKTKKAGAEKLIKKGKSDEAKKLLAELANKGNKSPLRKRYKINDATVEKLGELLNENPNGLLLERDELAGFIATLERLDRQSDKAFYLEAWNGKQSFTYDRIGRGTIDIEAATVSIIGGIQPDKMRRQIQGAIDCDESNDGFIQRFQLLVYPDINKKWGYVDKLLNKQAEEQVNDVFQRIDAIENEEQVVLKFTKEAQEIFIEWLTEHEKKLRSGLHPAIESHLTKYRSLVPSLALIIYLAESAEYKAVDETSIIKACGWAEYLESHMYRVYSIGSNTTAQDAKLLSQRLHKLSNPFTVRDVYQKNWVGLKRDTKRIKTALEMLEDNNYILATDRFSSGGGRATKDYHINPLVLNEKGGE